MRARCPSLPSAWDTSSWPWPPGRRPARCASATGGAITRCYVVTAESVDPAVAEVSHINVNEGSVEGLRYRRPNCFTVQFHPEAAPGPMDTEYLFDRFVDSMKGGRAHA